MARVDVVRRHRRDSTEVVDAGTDEASHGFWAEIRRGLHTDVVVEQEARERNRMQQLCLPRVVRLGHWRLRVASEVLDDDLLNVAMASVQVSNSEQSVHPLGNRLADADEQTRGKGNP